MSTRNIVETAIELRKEDQVSTWDSLIRHASSEYCDRCFTKKIKVRNGNAKFKACPQCSTISTR